MTDSFRSSGALPGDTTLVTRASTLDGFADAVAHVHGIALAELAPLDVLRIHTRNTCYTIVALRPPAHDVLVQGGLFFPTSARARLSGSSLGGSCLKLGWVGPGFQMEIHANGQRIVTTRVRSVEVQDGSSLAGPF